MIKIITNMPPRNSAIMRLLLDGMDKIEAFRRDVVAINREASEMTRGPTRVCPHEFSRIVRTGRGQKYHPGWYFWPTTVRNFWLCRF